MILLSVEEFKAGGLVDGVAYKVVSAYENGEPVSYEVLTFKGEVAELVKHITLGSFRSRFTLAEKVAIENAVKTDLEVKVISEDLSHSAFVDVDDLELQWGLAHYVQKGLLTNDRLSILLRDGTQDEAF
jgi:hypothetical protein